MAPISTQPKPHVFQVAQSGTSRHRQLPVQQPPVSLSFLCLSLEGSGEITLIPVITIVTIVVSPLSLSGCLLRSDDGYGHNGSALLSTYSYYSMFKSPGNERFALFLTHPWCLPCCCCYCCCCCCCYVQVLVLVLS